MRTASNITVAALTLLTATAVAARAQSNNAGIQVTAVVQQPINVTGTSALAFGNVFPGVNKTVAPTDPGAGTYAVTGQASTPVSLTFVLPGPLTSGINTLPIGSFKGNWNGTNAPTGTNFTPSAAPTAATLSGSGQLFVFVGATVTPATNQAAGSYTGSLQMTVVY